MPRPTTKQQLMESGEDNYKKLFTLISSMSAEDQQKAFAFEDRDRNIRDVLIHLYEWHQLLLNWIKSNQTGDKVLPEPYNWKTYPQMNVEFWKKHQATSLEMAVSLLQKSHSDVMNIIDTFSSEELFTNKYFTWTGTTSLGSYCVSAAAGHYDWAMKKIKKHKKELG